MVKNEYKKGTESVCELMYLKEMMKGNKKSILGVIDVFLIQISEELFSLNEAVSQTNYAIIKSFSHTMKSTVSIMGISCLVPLLKEMEDLAKIAGGIEKITELNQQLNLICEKAIEEIENARLNFV